MSGATLPSPEFIGGGGTLPSFIARDTLPQSCIEGGGDTIPLILQSLEFLVFFQLLGKFTLQSNL